MKTFSIRRAVTRVLGALLIAAALASGAIAVVELAGQQHEAASTYCVKSEPAPAGATTKMAPVGDFRLFPLGIACTWQTNSDETVTTYPDLAPSGFAAIAVVCIIGAIVAFRVKPRR